MPLPVFFWVWLVGAETWYQEFVKISNFVWVSLISDSLFRNHLSMSSMTVSGNIFLLQNYFQYSSSKKKSWHLKTFWPQNRKWKKSFCSWKSMVLFTTIGGCISVKNLLPEYTVTSLQTWMLFVAFASLNCNITVQKVSKLAHGYELIRWSSSILTKQTCASVISKS